MNYSSMSKHISTIKEVKSVTKGAEGVTTVVNNFAILNKNQRYILELASEANDEGTVVLLSDYISQTEKTLWMLNWYLQ